eukprot:112895_1
MGDSLECASDILDGLKSLAKVVNYLFSGLSFGLIPSVSDIEREEDNLEFALILARASQSLYGLYCVTLLIAAMYYDFNSIYNILITSVAFLITFWFIFLMKKRSKDKKDKSDSSLDNPDLENGFSGFAYFLHYAATLLLCIRMLVNTYFLISHILNPADAAPGEYEFEIIHLSFDCFFLLLFTLVLYLPLIIKDGETKTQGKRILTVWAMEYGDIIAHLTVCMLYAPTLESHSGSFGDVYLIIYFVIYCINVTVFCLPLPWVSNYASTYHPMIIHTMSLDFITDLPFTVVTLAGSTYVDNLFITIDVVINIITFIRGMVWVPVEFKTKELNATKIAQYMLYCFGIILGGLTTLSCVFGPGVWLLINGFGVGNASDCHAGTLTGIHWDVWFHMAGWSWVVLIVVLIGIGYKQFNDYAEELNVPLLVIMVALFIMGAIGCAMYDQTTSRCRFTAQGYTLLVYSIIYTVVGAIGALSTAIALCGVKKVSVYILYFCGGMLALAMAMAPGLWLLNIAFSGGNDCHLSTAVAIHWDVWFHIVGWCWVVLIVPLIAVGFKALTGNGDAMFFGIPFALVFFILGCIGCAMYDQTTSPCRFTTEGTTMLVYSIFFVVTGAPGTCVIVMALCGQLN